MLASDTRVLYEQSTFHMQEITRDKLPNIENFIYKTDIEELKWIEHSTEFIADWRYRLRSTYTRWSLCINGLFVAQEKYSSPEWKKPERQFYVSSVRVNQQLQLQQVPIAVWDGEFTAKASIETASMLHAWAIIDIYRCLEEFTFSLYRIYLDHHPDILIKGDDFKHLRRLFRKAKDSDEDNAKWKHAWQERLNNWQRKRLYDGLGKVLAAYCNQASLKGHPKARFTTPDNWAETVEGIALLRNALTHGEKKVPKELAEFCTKPHRMTFDFVEGDILDVKLHHLMGVECFCDQLLSVLNISLMELSILHRNA